MKTILYRTSHATLYEYSEPVSLCHNVFHLTARNGPWQARWSSELRMSPPPTVMTERHDYFGNTATFATIEEPHFRLSVMAINVVELAPVPACRSLSSPSWETVGERLRSDRTPDLLAASQFVYDSPYVPRSDRLAEFARPSFAPGRPLLDAALDLTARIHAEFRYDPTATTIATPTLEVLQRRHGVCQDFAHLQIGCFRSLGLAARYMSGYLLSEVAPHRPGLLGAEASHAWVSVFCPRLGWIDFDPTNNLFPCDRHIVLAWGRDYDDVSPIKGVILGGGRHSMEVRVEIKRVPEHEIPQLAQHRDEPPF
jgi:transglutaminase-like putative cysteine protease